MTFWLNIPYPKTENSLQAVYAIPDSIPCIDLIACLSTPLAG